MTESTPQTRQRIRRARRELEPDAARAAALTIAQHLCKAPTINRAGTIAVYFATQNEVDCSMFAYRMAARGKRLYAPVLRKNRLLFAPFAPGSSYRHNRYGIAEPVCLQRDLRQAQQLDVIITPLVAFDAALNRIGMGGGYYDRTLAFKKYRRHWTRPRTIGAAYSFQRIDSVRIESWDIPLDAVITEKESYGSY